MILMALDEFAAARRRAQELAIDALVPIIADALRHWREGTVAWASPVLDAVHTLYLDTLRSEAGTTSGQGQTWARLRRDLSASLRKTTEPDEHTAQTLAVYLSTAALNSAYIVAARIDPEELLLEWVTMHDSHVRTAHRDTDGQQRPVGEKFDVDGTDMRYPGDPTAPIELWINCRCALRPILASNASMSYGEHTNRGVEMTTTEPEPTDTVPMMPLEWHGILAPEGVFSGDGRQFAPNSLTHRDLPLPLTWQRASAEGHGGSVTVGMITSIERVDSMMQASGTFLDNPEADEVVGLLAQFGKFGVSVDADNPEMEFNEDDETVTFSAARICSAAIVNIPAFAEAYVAIGPWVTDESIAAGLTAGRGPGWITNPIATKRIHDYWTVPGEEGYEKIGWGIPGDFNRCRVEIGEEIGENSPEALRFLNQICAQWHHDATGFWPGRAPTEQNLEGEMAPAVSLVASVDAPVPGAWFTNPGLTQPTPLTITDDGQVFGHIAMWTSCHIGYTDMCVSPPHSESDYAYFALGEVLTTDGPVAVGSITIGGGHAPAGLRARAAASHYDSTSAVVADIAVGEDEVGIWFSGALRPGVDEAMVAALRAAKLSGDWRKVRGEMEMVAALAVNVPGFPIPRVQIAAANEGQITLVAAGIVDSEPAPLSIDIDKFAEAVVDRMEARVKRREKMAALAARFQGEN